MSKVSRSLQKDPALREAINEVLGEIKAANVKHLVQVLLGDIGLDSIASSIEVRLDKLRLAIQYGCHLLRPSDVVAFDHPEFPSSFDKLVEQLGCRSVRYRGRVRCCGAPTLAVNRDRVRDSRMGAR